MNDVTNSAGEFALEPPVEPGNVPESVISELRRLRTRANEGATDFREAVKVQADKHKIKPAALRRYIVALANDKISEVGAEAADLEHLIESGPAIAPGPAEAVVSRARGRKSADAAPA